MIEYEVTAQRQAYLEARGYTILSACPGSGKTTSIVHKLLDISDYCTKQYGRHTGFACLSFTNKACGELLDKYMEMHGKHLAYPNIVSTIDSFIMQNIILPFWYLCDLCKSKPVVVNEDEVLAEVYKNYVPINGKLNVYPVMALRPYCQLTHVYPPEKVIRTFKGFSFGHSSDITNDELKKYCQVAFCYRLEKGVVNSQDALWIAVDIISRYPHVAKILVKRFPYIIVDEAQDNSYLQFVFFEKLKRAGLQNLEYVGDICQSIYGFRNAYPKALQSLMSCPEWKNIHFTECRRSNQRIINLYSKLIPNPIPSIVSKGVEDLNIDIVIYKYDFENKTDVIRDFLDVCKNNDLSTHCILARGTSLCKRLAGVSDLKFKYWKSFIPYSLIDAKIYFEKGELEKAFNKIKIVLCELFYTPDKFSERKIFLADMESNLEWNIKIIRFIKEIPSLSLTFREWTQITQKMLQDYWNLTQLPDFQVHIRLRGYKMKEMSDRPVEAFYGSSEKNSKFRNLVNTIHSAKGTTVDAVLLFLSKDSQGQNISLDDFLLKTQEGMTEAQRLLYVACSRAKHFLALAVPATIPESKIKAIMQNVDYVLKQP